MVIYMYILLIPIVIMTTGTFVLKAVEMGLNWQKQKEEGKPVEKVRILKKDQETVHSVQHKPQQISNEILDEWVGGKG